MRPQDEKLDTRNDQRNGHGFSLLELLIVVAIILIIASIAIPNFIRSKMRANEAATVQNLRNITTAEVIYSTTYSIGYSPTLAALGGNSVTVDATAAGLIDEVLASGVKSGYTYSYSIIASDPQGHVTAYNIIADPVVVGSSGINHFYTDQSAVIRENGSGTASSSDTPIN